MSGAETFPRWGLNDVNFLEIDGEKIAAAVFAEYEKASGRVLATGDPVRLFLLSIIDVIIQLKNNINSSAQQNLLSYSQGAYLDALGVLLDVSRLPAAKAVTTLEFTLSEALQSAYDIPVGTEVTNGVVTFATSEVLTIPPGEITGSVTAHCTIAGEAGNGYLPGQVQIMVKPLTFVQSANNTSLTTGGADDEADVDYAERLRLAPNAFSVAGPYKAYIFHALSVSASIIDVAVDSPNPGEVKVYPLIEGGTLPSEELLTAVYDYLSSDDIRPLTDEVEVLTPTAYNYNIQVDYWIDNSKVSIAEKIRTDIAQAVEEYRLWQQSKIGRDITPDELICKVKNAGASRIDFSTLSPATWVKLEPNEVAQCGTVTVNYKGYKEE